jgi:hypothetical protein
VLTKLDFEAAAPKHDLQHVFAGTLHSGSYPDTLAFLRSLASLDTAALTSAAPSHSLDSADREAAAELFDWQV